MYQYPDRIHRSVSKSVNQVLRGAIFEVELTVVPVLALDSTQVILKGTSGLVGVESSKGRIISI